jgi:hypothetical protein
MARLSNVLGLIKEKLKVEVLRTLGIASLCRKLILLEDEWSNRVTRKWISLTLKLRCAAASFITGKSLMSPTGSPGRIVGVPGSRSLYVSRNDIGLMKSRVLLCMTASQSSIGIIWILMQSNFSKSYIYTRFSATTEVLITHHTQK